MACPRYFGIIEHVENEDIGIVFFLSHFYIMLHINNVIKRITNALMNNATRGKYIRGARDARYRILNQVFGLYGSFRIVICIRAISIIEIL